MNDNGQSPTLRKRLEAIADCRLDSILTETELEWLTIASFDAVPGVGGQSPPYLDITCINVTDPSACAAPGWISLICRHGNMTGKYVRCRRRPGCQHSWRSKGRALCMQGSALRETFFWTITVKEYPNQMGGCRFDFIESKWRRLRALAAKGQQHFEYLRVTELQRRGSPHYHLAVNRWVYMGEPVGGLRAVKLLARRLTLGAGFGVQWDFQKARLGARGVAAYMAKYLGKGDEFNELVRADGRAVRRYVRSRHWVGPADLRTFRYAAIPHSFTYQPKGSTTEVPCVCGSHESLLAERQVQHWLKLNRSVGRWVAPLAVADWIFKNEGS